MDRFHPPHTYQAQAHRELSEMRFSWDWDCPSLNETLIAGCASYQAFSRYLSGSDLFILPRTRTELESILRRYCYDAIHNAIAKARSPLQQGGYTRISHLAGKSMKEALDEGDNVEFLLGLHRPQQAPPRDSPSRLESSPMRPIKTT